MTLSPSRASMPSHAFHRLSGLHTDYGQTLTSERNRETPHLDVFLYLPVFPSVVHIRPERQDGNKFGNGGACLYI
jgi:hypothetical protein